MRLTAGEGNLKSAFRAMIDTDIPWVREYPSQIVDNAVANLQTAFTNFWRMRKQGVVAQRIAQKKANGEAWNRWLRKQLKRGRKGVQVEPGYPQFKSKFRTRPSFTMSASEVKDGCIYIGASRGSKWAGHGWRLAEKDRIPDGKYKTTTFSRDGTGAWFVSVPVEYKPELLDTTGEILGVDVGVAVAVAVSDGTLYENNRHLARYNKRLRDLQRKLSRQELKSNGWKKTQAKIARLHAKIANMRQHDRHNITSDIIYNKRPGLVRVEDLQVKNMTGKARPKLREDGNGYAPNKRRQKAGLNRAILEVAPYELRRQLEYKGKWVGVDVQAVPAAYTSQTCSRCGHTAAENRATRDKFCCVECGYTAHADINAACVIRDKMNP